MTSITEIQELARTLNLQNLARGDIDITNDKDSQRAYLLKILQEEVNLRHQANLVKREKIARIPKKEFCKDRLNSGVAWQIDRLEQLDWIEQDQNLILIGKCATGKTSLSAHLGKKALEAGIKVCYSTFDDFIYTIRNKTTIEKQKNRWRYFTYSSLIIVDDVMYTGMTGEELMLFYHSMMLLNETRSIVLITNRELSAWVEAAEDKHLMQTFLDRITTNSQIIRLN